jgi:hypothetical protein
MELPAVLRSHCERSEAISVRKNGLYLFVHYRKLQIYRSSFIIHHFPHPPQPYFGLF